MSTLLTASEYFRRVSAGESHFNFSEKKCHKCGLLLDYLDKESGYKIGDDQVCGGCYFEALGEEVEKYPIGRSTPHGGCT